MFILIDKGECMVGNVHETLNMALADMKDWYLDHVYECADNILRGSSYAMNIHRWILVDVTDNDDIKIVVLPIRKWISEAVEEIKEEDKIEKEWHGEKADPTEAAEAYGRYLELKERFGGM